MDDLFTSLLPAYIISKVIGTVPFNPVGVKGERKFEINNVTCIYGLILTTCHALLTIWVYIRIFTSDGEKVYGVMLFLQCVGDMGLILTILCSNYYYKNDQVVLLNIIAELDVELKQMGVLPNYRKIMKYSCARIAMEIVLICVCYLMVFYADDGISGKRLYLYFSNYILGMMLKFSVFLQLENWLLILCERFNAIRENLVSVLEVTSQYAKSDHSRLICAIGKTASTHKKLCSYVKKLNDMYSWQLLITITLVFVILLTHMFNFCRFIIRMNSVDTASVINSVFWLGYYSIKILILCSLCSGLSGKVRSVNYLIIYVNLIHLISVLICFSGVLF